MAVSRSSSTQFVSTTQTQLKVKVERKSTQIFSRPRQISVLFLTTMTVFTAVSLEFAKAVRRQATKKGLLSEVGECLLLLKLGGKFSEKKLKTHQEERAFSVFSESSRNGS